jgi:excisionase family DNA binding protein
MKKTYSTREAASKLKLSYTAINRYIAAKKIPAPRVQRVGATQFRAWTEDDIERVRRVLPKIANGRKTRHKKTSKTGKSEK